MANMMGRLPEVEPFSAPECAVAVVVSTNKLAEIGVLLREFASEPAAIVLWHLDAEGALLPADLGAILAESPFRVQPLAAHDALQPGVVHLVLGQRSVWFEGQQVRAEALSETCPRRVDRFLSSLADCWGRRSVAVISRISADDGEAGLRAVRAAGGLGLGPLAFEWSPHLRLDTRGSPSGPDRNIHSSPRAARSNLASRAWLKAQRMFSLPRSVHGCARAVAQTAVEETRARGRLRIWLPGCKTGNRVYTLAMLLSDAAAQLEVPLRLQIFGTDHDEGALAVARAGRYPARAALDMDPSWRARYTFDEGETIRVSEALREICVFSSHRLMRDPPLSRMDLIVCDRVFGRIAPARKPEIVHALHFALREKGLLLALDHADVFPENLFQRTADGYLRARPLRAKRLSSRPALPAQTVPAIVAPRAVLGDAAAASSATDDNSLVRGVRREQALAEAARKSFDLECFVHAIALPILFCDHELRILEMSTAACQAFGLTDADHGALLSELFDRIPSGADIALTAGRTLATGQTQDLTIRTGERAYLVRLSTAGRALRPGIAVAFTEVSDLDAAQRRAIAQQHQQAAVARVGNLALSLTNEAELFEEALGVLFGNISFCTSGIILERTGEGHELAILASRGLGDDPLRRLHELGEPARLLDAVLERGSPVMQADMGISPPVSSSAEAPGSKPRSAPFHSALPFVKGGIACPIVNEGRLLGIVALYARQDGLEASEHQHFVQAVANVLGGAIVRHRTRRRLALELEGSSVLASAVDASAAGRGLARSLAVALEASEVEIWAPTLGSSPGLVRLFPEAPEAAQVPSGLEAFLQDDGHDVQAPSYRITANAELRELVVPIARGNRVAALLRLTGKRLRSPDRDLGDGLRRIAFMLADFLDRLQIHDALKRSEAAFRQSSAEFEALYASLPVGVAIHELDGSVRRVNCHLERLAASADSSAAALEELYSEEVPPWIARVLAGGQPIRDVELTTTRGGDVQSWLCNLAAIRDPDGTILGASSVVQDITALKRVEASLREADKQKDDFLAMLGHELRNPMAAIRNATALLSRMEPSSPQLLRLQSIFDRQTLQTTKLIDGLLDVSRVARGKVELQIATVDAVELVQRVIDDRRHEIGARQLQAHIPPEPLWVAADKVRFVQIMDNLLSNAIKFTTPAGRVVVELSRQGNRGLVRLTDDGFGIEPELLPYIFEPFRQGRAAARQPRGGLGLGLALVKGLTELHHFDLAVHSAGAGRGACFEIRFTLTAAPVEQAPESKVETRPLTLLLVEDNVDIADTLAELLQDAGHQIEVVGSAEHALVTLETRRPDIVLCDIGLPGMDGLALATRLRDEPGLRDLKLIAMTGYGDASTRACIERAGFDRYLIKPVQLNSLQHCLTRLAAAPAQWINRR